MDQRERDELVFKNDVYIGFAHIFLDISQRNKDAAAYATYKLYEHKSDEVIVKLKEATE